MSRIVCAPETHPAAVGPSDLRVALFGAYDKVNGAVGASIRQTLIGRKLEPANRAWDLLVIALSVVSADMGVQRTTSPDGWTRQLELDIAVGEPEFWTSQRDLLKKQLQFLTSDIWNVSFSPGGYEPQRVISPVVPDNDCVVLLSGGLDSLIGAADLARGLCRSPYAVSQVTLGDKQKQRLFSSSLGLDHIQLNHNLRIPGHRELSQRSRSLLFYAYGALVATALRQYQDGRRVVLYVPENGFISINPPLTASRLGSLSTRTTHPVYVHLFQQLLDNAGLNVTVQNPYQFKTKGEMLLECMDQDFIVDHAHMTTSCGNYARNVFRNCGRCLPCLIRRAAFAESGLEDTTPYTYPDLSLHTGHDDVRCAAMAVAAVGAEGLSRWLGATLSHSSLGDTASYKDVVRRGLAELADFLDAVPGI